MQLRSQFVKFLLTVALTLLLMQHAVAYIVRHQRCQAFPSGFRESFFVSSYNFNHYAKSTSFAHSSGVKGSESRNRPLGAALVAAPAPSVSKPSLILHFLTWVKFNISRTFRDFRLRMFSWLSFPLRLLSIMLPTISVLLPFAASAAMKADARRDVIVAMKQTKERKPSKSVQTFKEKLPSERQLQLGQKDDLLNKVGVLLVGGSIAYIAATGGDSKAPKQLKKKRKQPRLTRKDMTASPPTRSRKASFAVTEDDDDDEEEEAEVDGSGGRVSSWQRQPDERLQKQMRSIMVPSSPDELFGDDESIDDIFGDADTEPDSPRIEKRKASAASPASRDGPEPASPPLEVERVEHISPMLGQRAGRTSAAAAREPAGKSSAYSAGDSAEPSLPPYATIIPAPEVSKVESVTSRAAAASRTEAAPAAAPGAARVGSSESGRAEEESSPSPPPPPQKKPGMFGRLFGQKPGGGRPTDLAKALSGSDSGSGGGGAGDEEAQRELRAVIGSCLSVQVPAGTFPELEPGGEFATSCADAFDSAEEKRIAAIKDVMQQFDMSEQEAGEAFAEVASAMIVRLVDQAAKALDTSKAAKEESEARAAEALDVVSRFISGAGAIFGGCTPRASISPIQYNGKAKKGKLESMFQLYLKQRGGDLTSSFQDLVKGLSDGDDGGDEGGATESDAPAAAGRGEAEPSPEEMADLVGKIQYLFDINANKREKIEQRIMREAVMSLGSGGKGSLEDMMGALTGGGGDGGMDAQMEELLKAAGVGGAGAGAGGMPDLGAAGGVDGLPDMSNMSQEDVAAMTQEAMASIKQSLAEGSITKEEIVEFEKMIGMDVNQLVKMVGSSGMNREKVAQQMGPEFADMIEVFKQLAALKRR